MLKQRVLYCLFLLCSVMTFFSSNTKAENITSEQREYSIFIKFADSNKPNIKPSKILKELCDKEIIGTVHSLQYYKRNGISGEPNEIKKAKYLIKGIAEIARMAGKKQFDNKERIASLKQLVRLETKVLDQKDIGYGNFLLADEISLTISGLLKQHMKANKLKSFDGKLALIANRHLSQSPYTKTNLGLLLKREFFIDPNYNAPDAYEMLMEAFRNKYSSVIQSNKDEIKDGTIEGLNLTRIVFLVSNDFTDDQFYKCPLYYAYLPLFIHGLIYSNKVEVGVRTHPSVYKKYLEFNRSLVKHEEIFKFCSDIIKQNTNEFEKKFLKKFLECKSNFFDEEFFPNSEEIFDTITNIYYDSYVLPYKNK